MFTPVTPHLSTHWERLLGGTLLRLRPEPGSDPRDHGSHLQIRLGNGEFERTSVLHGHVPPVAGDSSDRDQCDSRGGQSTSLWWVGTGVSVPKRRPKDLRPSLPDTHPKSSRGPDVEGLTDAPCVGRHPDRPSSPTEERVTYGGLPTRTVRRPLSLRPDTLPSEGGSRWSSRAVPKMCP